MTYEPAEWGAAEVAAYRAGLAAAAAWHQHMARHQAHGTGNAARHEYYAEQILALPVPAKMPAAEPVPPSPFRVELVPQEWPEEAHRVMEQIAELERTTYARLRDSGVQHADALRQTAEASKALRAGLADYLAAVRGAPAMVIRPEPEASR